MSEAAQGKSSTEYRLYQDASKPIEARVEDLLSRMTLEEKAAQLCGDLAASFLENGKVSREKLRERFANGHGRITQYSLVGLADPAQIAAITNELQDFFIHETRLGIPVALQSENLCGYPGAGGTLFPAQINVGSTWEPELAEEMSAVIGQESRAVGITSAMSPVVDVSRDPRWGRTYETYGEDYYLNSQMGIGYVRGMQAQGVSCIAKHFLGYAETQAGLNMATVRLSDRELYEVFATPFEAAAKVADLDAMMANYAEIDGMPVISNQKIARKLLRDTMGFEGMLTSDGGAVWQLFQHYKVAKTYQEAGLLAKKGGCDTEIPVGGAFRSLPDYVRSGELPEELLDESVRRILTIKFKRGLFENPYADIQRLEGAMRNEKKEALSREIAAKSLILLENDGILPLPAGKRLAVIGPHADSLRYPVSGYTYPAYIEMLDWQKKQQGEASFHGILEEEEKARMEARQQSGQTDKRAKNKKPREPFESMYEQMDPEAIEKLSDMNGVLREYHARSLKETLGDRFEIVYAQGCDITAPGQEGFAEAVQAAKESDIVVMALGGNCGWVGTTGGEGKDRSSLDLPGVQQQLLEAVAATGKPIVLVLYGPGIFAVNWAKEHASAILQAWMPGPFAGEAVADVLDGTRNPGGKLTVTIPRNAGQIPIFYNHKNGSGYALKRGETNTNLFSGGYTDGPGTPLYPFGYGLSYTSFALSGLEVNGISKEPAAEKQPILEQPVFEQPLCLEGSLTIRCQISNTGEREGDEVVQLYTSFCDAHVSRPNKQLAGFKRVSLQAGETKKVLFHLDLVQLGFYNENMEFVAEPGRLDLMVGTSSEELPLHTSVTLTGEPIQVMGRRSYVCRTEVK